MWATLGLLGLLKISTLLLQWHKKAPLPKGVGWWIYLLAWPGVRPESFSQRNSLCLHQDSWSVFKEGMLFGFLGLLLQISLSYFWPLIPAMIRQSLGIASFLLFTHFAFCGFFYGLWSRCGYPVEHLFKSPFLSKSLRDFWGQRWNLAFVDMDKRILLPLFPKSLPMFIKAFLIFIISGLLHEIAFSYPAQGGWGKPLLYFVIHGLLVGVEPHITLLNKYQWLKKIWIWSTLILLSPLLFHQEFINIYIIPYFENWHLFLRDELFSLK